jgi:hypothetical protein
VCAALHESFEGEFSVDRKIDAQVPGSLIRGQLPQTSRKLQLSLAFLRSRDCPAPAANALPLITTLVVATE